jgi:hypothetical protein
MINKSLISLAPVHNNKSFIATFEQEMEMNHTPTIQFKEILNTEYGNKKRDLSLTNQESQI